MRHGHGEHRRPGKGGDVNTRDTRLHIKEGDMSTRDAWLHASSIVVSLKITCHI